MSKAFLSTLPKKVTICILVVTGQTTRSMSEDEGVSAGLDLSAAMGCEQEDVYERLSCLQGLEAGDIFSQRYALDQEGDVIPAPPATYMGYAGVVDAGYMGEGEAFLPENPLKLAEEGEGVHCVISPD